MSEVHFRNDKSESVFSWAQSPKTCVGSQHKQKTFDYYFDTKYYRRSSSAHVCLVVAVYNIDLKHIEFRVPRHLIFMKDLDIPRQHFTHGCIYNIQSTLLSESHHLYSKQKPTPDA